MILNKINISEAIGGRLDFQYVTYKQGLAQYKYPIVQLSELLISKPQYGANEAGIDRVDNKVPRYIRITDINEYGVLSDDLGASATTIEEKYILNNDDIIIARSGNTVGKAYIHKTEHIEYPCFFAGYMIRFIVDTNLIIPDFLFILTQLSFYKKWVKAIQRMTGQPNINAEEYKTLPIPLPPIEIQQQIVDIYTTAQKAKQAKEEQANTLLDSVDDYLLSQLGIILPTKEATQKIYKVKLSDLLGARLNPARYNPNTIALNNISQSNTLPKMHLADMVISNIAGDWGKDESEITDNYTRCLVIRATEFDNRYNLNIDNLRTKYRQIKTDKLNKMDVRTCDILIEKSGGSPDQPVGRVAYITDEIVKDNNTIAYSNFIQKIRIDQTKANSEYVYYYLRTMYRIGITESMQSQTNGIRNLQMNNYFQQTVLLPDNQNEIVKHIRAIYTQAKALEEEAVVVLKSAKKQIEKKILG